MPGRQAGGALAEIYYLKLLPPGAVPRRRDPLRFDEVKMHRHLGCPFYARCLHFVARSPWSSFTCQGCERFPLAGPLESPFAQHQPTPVA